MLLKIIDVLTRCILIPSIWIFIFYNIPELRNDFKKLILKIISAMKKVEGRNNLLDGQNSYKKVA